MYRKIDFKTSDCYSFVHTDGKRVSSKTKTNKKRNAIKISYKNVNHSLVVYWYGQPYRLHYSTYVVYV